MRRVTSPGNSDVPTQPTGSVPPPLHVASALAGLEAFLLIGYGLSLVPAMEQERVAMGLTSLAFFLLYGGGLAWCAWHLRRRQTWARSFVVFAQLIQLGVAWSFRADPTTYVAVAIALVALVTLAGIFHPQSLRALDPRPQPD